MAWYEGQIIGVIAGGLLTFFTVEGHKRLEEKRERRRLLAGIRAELQAHKEVLMPVREQLEIFDFEKRNLLSGSHVGFFSKRHTQITDSQLAGFLQEAPKTK